jgi:hypothetical protein
MYLNRPSIVYIQLFSVTHMKRNDVTTSRTFNIIYYNLHEVTGIRGLMILVPDDPLVNQEVTTTLQY